MNETKETKFGWVFALAAVLILIFALDVVWWAAILVVILANIELTFTTTTTYRRR